MFRYSKTLRYALGCIGVLVVGATLAAEPAATTRQAPAGCTDSQRGRTHVLRFCGDKHYWIRVASAGPGAPRHPGRLDRIPDPVAVGGFEIGQTASTGSDAVSSAGLNGAGR